MFDTGLYHSIELGACAGKSKLACRQCMDLFSLQGEFFVNNLFDGIDDFNGRDFVDSASRWDLQYL